MFLVQDVRIFLELELRSFLINFRNESHPFYLWTQVQWKCFLWSTKSFSSFFFRCCFQYKWICLCKGKVNCKWIDEKRKKSIIVVQCVRSVLMNLLVLRMCLKMPNRCTQSLPSSPFFPNGEDKYTPRATSSSAIKFNTKHRGIK